MTYLNIIKKWNIESLELLYYGYLKGWVERQGVVDFAMNSLNESHAESMLAQIALENFSDELEFKSMVEGFLKELDCSLTAAQMAKLKEMWLLIVLEELNEADSDENKKVEMLQSIYADFDFPKEMSSCSIYSEDSIPPLVAMHDLLQKLKQTLLS